MISKTVAILFHLPDFFYLFMLFKEKSERIDGLNLIFYTLPLLFSLPIIRLRRMKEYPSRCSLSYSNLLHKQIEISF